MAGIQPWFATQGTITIGAVEATVTTGSTLGDMLSGGNAHTTYCKNVSISGGGVDLTAGNLFGLNQFQEVGRADAVTCTLTLVARGKDALEEFWTQHATITHTTYTTNRYQGTETTTQKGILLSFTDGTNTARWFLNNAQLSTDNIFELAADGTSEMSITIKCLLQDTYVEDDWQ